MKTAVEDRTYVAGRWATGEEVLAVEDPATGSTFAELTATPLTEIEGAVAAARRSFDDGGWADRARVLHAFLDHLEAATADLVPVVVGEAGQPTMFAERMQVRGGIALAGPPSTCTCRCPRRSPTRSRPTSCSGAAWPSASAGTSRWASWPPSRRATGPSWPSRR